MEQYLPIIGALIVAIIGPLLGLWVYFRQKEYEFIRKRYLEEGIDVLSQEVEHVLGIFWYNWHRSLTLIHHFRAFGPDTVKEVHFSNIQVFDASSFKVSRHYILKELIHDDSFYELQQRLFSLVRESSEFSAYGIIPDIQKLIEEKSEETEEERKEMTKPYYDKLEEYRKDDLKFYDLLGTLQNIATVFQRERFTFKKIAQFYSSPEAKKFIVDLKIKFKNELEEAKKERFL